MTENVVQTDEPEHRLLGHGLGQTVADDVELDYFSTLLELCGLVSWNVGWKNSVWSAHIVRIVYGRNDLGYGLLRQVLEGLLVSSSLRVGLALGVRTFLVDLLYARTDVYRGEIVLIIERYGHLFELAGRTSRQVSLRLERDLQMRRRYLLELRVPDRRVVRVYLDLEHR